MHQQFQKCAPLDKRFLNAINFCGCCREKFGLHCGFSGSSQTKKSKGFIKELATNIGFGEV
jgi:hypothetical protein